FFQAEDGIRDFHVTGVQTCALPISSALDEARSQMACVVGASVRAARSAGWISTRSPQPSPTCTARVIDRSPTVKVTLRGTSASVNNPEGATTVPGVVLRASRS